MRVRRPYAVLILTVMVIATTLLFWYIIFRQTRILPREKHDLESPVANEIISNLDLEAVAAQYRDEQEYRKKCRIAKSFAASQTLFWEACARRRLDHFDERDALQHFAAAYYKRGPQQREELISLLHSQDEELVGCLLLLLSETSELGPNDELRFDTGLGGSEIAHYIAGVYKTHPSLGMTIVSALGNYGPAAKSEVRIVLRVLLSTTDPTRAFVVKVALRQIDSDGVYAQFGLDSPGALTDEQLIAIKKYLASQDE